LATRKINVPKIRKGMGVNVPMPQPLPQQTPPGPPKMPVAEHDFVEVGDKQWESAGPPKFHRIQAPAQTQETPEWKVPEKTPAANQKTRQNAPKFVDGKARNKMGFLPLKYPIYPITKNFPNSLRLHLKSRPGMISLNPLTRHRPPLDILLLRLVHLV
jgi:hypothetical protein